MYLFQNYDITHITHYDLARYPNIYSLTQHPPNVHFEIHISYIIHIIHIISFTHTQLVHPFFLFSFLSLFSNIHKGNHGNEHMKIEHCSWGGNNVPYGACSLSAFERASIVADFALINDASSSSQVAPSLPVQESAQRFFAPLPPNRSILYLVACRSSFFSRFLSPDVCCKTV